MTEREEAAKLAKEYRNYADKMPNDAYRRRWEIIGRALDHYSKHAVDEAAES
jgi:hypothetical protein